MTPFREAPRHSHSEIVLRAGILLRELEQRAARIALDPVRRADNRERFRAIEEKWHILMNEMRSMRPE
jgi:hypothetical protein